MCTQVFIGQKASLFGDNTDGQVDTTEGKNLFHATAMTVYQRQPTIDDRTYLTKAQHPESHLSSLSMAWLLCLNLVFTKVTLITVKAFQHFLFAQLTANLSATARHIYDLKSFLNRKDTKACRYIDNTLCSCSTG